MLHLYAYHEEVRIYNHLCFRDCKQPIFKLKPTDTGRSTEDTSSNEPDRLDPERCICLGMGIMYSTHNAYIKNGLVNG
jgi:hypothetical protein